MSISSVLNSGLNAIQAGTGIVGRAGGRIATFGTTQDLAQLQTAMVDLRVGETQVKLAADVVKVADQVLGTLIDIRA